MSDIIYETAHVMWLCYILHKMSDLPATTCCCSIDVKLKLNQEVSVDFPMTHQCRAQKRK